MAKRYTAAEWARIQSRLPEEDRVPYSESPDAPTPQELAATTFPTVAAITSRARASSDAASGAIGSAQAALGDYYAAQAAAGEAAAKALLSTSTTATTAAVTPTTATAPAVTATTATTAPAVTATTATTPAVIATTATTATSAAVSAKSAVGTYVDPASGDVFILYSDGTRELASKGTKAADAAAAAAAAAAAQEAAAKAAREAKRAAGQSAYSLLFEQFNQYGLGGLVEPLKKFIMDGLSPAEFTLRLRETDAYKKRFAANQSRIQRGLRALSEAEYIGLEDQYQNIMRNYGLPQSYYTRGEMGRQEGFEKFIAGDVSAAELEDRIQTAQNRVINAAPEVSRALRQFYPSITNGDILAYALDPEKALTDIRRKVTAAEIGAGAMQAGLATDVSRAEELGAFGITGERARAGYQTVADILPTAQKLSDIYSKQGLGPYSQATAEQEVFGITGAAEAGRKRRKLSELEQASFSGQSGLTGGALGRERAGSF